MSKDVQQLSPAHPAPSRHKVAPWRIWTGILLAPLAFVTLVITSYSVSARGCEQSAAPAPWLIAINVIVLAAIVASVIMNLQNARATHGERCNSNAELHDVGEGRTQFLAHYGLLTSILFAVAVIVQLTAILLVHSCIGVTPF
jgi:lysylphosphatidylglycerol synthetase-like protein (DUF2156 family)